MPGRADPLICKEHKLIRATTLRQQREGISMQSVQSVVVVEAALSSYCNQLLSADVLASLRTDLRGICDAFRAILVHVCVSCDISGLLSVCTWPVFDSVRLMRMHCHIWGCRALYLCLSSVSTTAVRLSLSLPVLTFSMRSDVKQYFEVSWNTTLPLLTSHCQYFVIWEYLIYPAVKLCTCTVACCLYFCLT